MSRQVRQARLDDTQAISSLFRSQISVWQRMDEQGQVEDLPYQALTIYERWLHGGAWMTLETGAIWLSHLLRGAGVPLIVETDGAVRAYAEVYRGEEPEPFGDHLHLAHLLVDPDQKGAGLDDLFMEQLPSKAQELGCARLTVSCSSFDADAVQFYRRHKLKPRARYRRYSVRARTGQGFYKAVEHFDGDPAQIEAWSQLIGRTESSRLHWESLMPRHWEAVPEITARKTHRLHLTASGQEAFVICQQQLYAPRNADIYCWSLGPLTGQLLTAIRDWAHQEGYRTLMMTVAEDDAPALGPDAEAEPYHQEFHALDVQ